jgi:hypothetical protein
MSTGLANLRRRWMAARSRRAFDQALMTANTPAMQHELLTLASSRQFMNLPR